MKKILFAPAHYLLDKMGGGEYGWAYEIVDRLSRSGKITTFAICGNSNTDIPKTKLIKLYRKSHILDKKTRLKFIFQYFFSASKIINSEKIDIIHHILPFGYAETFNLIPILGLNKKIPFIIGPLQVPQTYSDPNTYVKIENNGKRIPVIVEGNGISKIYKLIKPVLRYLSKKTLERARLVVCIDNNSKRLYSRLVSPKKIIVIPCGVDTKRFSPKSHKNEVFEFLAIGYLYKRKRFDILIKAFSKIGCKEARLRLIGVGPEFNYLKNLVNRLGLDKRVIFNGFLPNTQIDKVYKKADVFLSASVSEAHPQALLEALSCGLPVISTLNHGSKSIVSENVGFLIPQHLNEIKIFENKMNQLINNENMRLKMARNARKLALSKYDWDNIIEQYLEIYTEVLE